MQERLIATALAAADAAGREIRPWFRRELETDAKSDLSPVTIADRAAETAIRAVIRERQPDHAILGEEMGSDAGGGGPYQWVIDPIDGTRAFITGRPTFGTLIALLEDGRPLIGIIDQPVTGERWIGVKGEPTRFRGPFGGTSGTRNCRTLSSAELSATSPDMFDPSARRRFDRLAAFVRRTSWGGDCYAYGLLALGRIDLIAEANLRPWDWAALVPVIEGAGGSVTDWAGDDLTLTSGGENGFEVLATGDKVLLEPTVEQLRDQG